MADLQNYARISRKIAVNTLLLMVACVVSLVLLELAVRILLPQYNPAGKFAFWCVNGTYLAPANSELRQWTNTGDFDVAVSINAYGFRDTKDTAHAADTDLFVVGDSFSFGQGVEAGERYSNRLQTALGTPVYNISIPTDFDGYASLLSYTTSLGARIGTLIVGVCMENDLQRYAETPYKCKPAAHRSLGALIRNPSLITFMAIKRYLTAYSATYSAFTNIIHQNPSLKSLAERIGLLRKFSFPGDKGFDEATIQRSADRLAEIASGHETVVLIIPSRALWLGENTATESRVHEAFLSAVRGKNLSVIDLRPRLEASGAPLKYHFAHDGHWNAAGHQLAATALVEFFAEPGQPSHTQNSTRMTGGR